MKRIAIAVALAACMAGPLWAQDEAAPEAATQDTTTAEQAAPEAPAAQQAPQMTPEMQAMMEAWTKASTPGAPQQQLAEHFRGDWSVKATMWMDPSAPPMTEAGTSTNTVEYGGRHVRSKYTGTFMGQPFTGEAITSYDNTKGKFINSWFDSMGTGQYMSEGDYDPATKTYTFQGTMSDPTKPDKTTTMKDTIRFTDADHYVMESYELADGKETKMMQLEYTRSGD